MLSRASHFEQVITQAASWNLLLIYLLRGKLLLHKEERQNANRFWSTSFLLITLSFKLFFLLNSLWGLSKKRGLDYVRQWNNCGQEGFKPTQSVQRLPHNEDVNAAMEPEQQSSAVICPKDLADALTYCIFIYNSHIGNCSDLRRGFFCFYVCAGQRQHVQCTSTPHSLGFMQNIG